MLAAAQEMFSERSYDSVKLEEIAERADVSVGTVYTYFKTKNSLLLAVLVDDYELALSYSNAVLSNPIVDCETSINELTHCYFLATSGGVTREMWRIAVAAYIREPDSEFAIEYDKSLSKMRQQYLALVVRLQDEGFLSRKISPTELANILYNTANMCFIEYLGERHATVDALMSRIKNHNKHLLRWVESTK